MITQERIKELFDYRDDGNLVRKVTVQSRSMAGQVAGGVTGEGRVLVSVDYRRYKAHRLVWLWHHGTMPPEIDHIDGNPSNNRIENLRAVTHAQNMKNSKMPVTNTTGYKGVRYHKGNAKWTAQISINNRSKYLGSFESPEDAAEAYRSAAREHYGEFARIA